MTLDIKKLVQDKKLTDTERQVLDYILDHLGEALGLGVREIARANYTSTSTIMRLAHKMGYDGFVDMCYRLRTLAQAHTEQLSEAQTFLDSFSLDSLLGYNTYDQLKVCAQHIARQKGTPIFVYATGFSATVGSYLAQKLTNMGRLCLFSSGQDSVGIFENSLDSISQYADLWFRVEDPCKLDDQNVRPNTFFPQALMLTELIAYEYHRLCSLPNEDRTDL